MADVKQLVDQRVSLESRLQNETSALSDSRARLYDHEYNDLQKQLAALFKSVKSDGHRITIMLEMMRILENRLVYLHNFIVDSTPDNRILAQLVTRFIHPLRDDRSPAPTPLHPHYS